MTVWCDPPAVRPDLWCELLEPVMERPGEWAMVRTYETTEQASQAAAYLRRAAAGGRGRVPSGVWEFRARRVKWGMEQFGVWARWLGEST